MLQQAAQCKVGIHPGHGPARIACACQVLGFMSLYKFAMPVGAICVRLRWKRFANKASNTVAYRNIDVGSGLGATAWICLPMTFRWNG